MTTAAVNQDVTSGLAYVTENQTSVRITYVDKVNEENGEKTFKNIVVSEDVAEKAQTDGTYEGKEIVELQPQTFQKYKFNSLQGALELMPEEEVVNMINSGTSVKQGNAIRSLLLGKDRQSGELDFTFTETPYDLRSVLSEVTNKRLSPTEKLVRDLQENLANVPPDMLDKFAQLIAARQAEANGGQLGQ